MNELENTIIDIIKEQQVKLGYVEETVRLYFPDTSMTSLLNINTDNKSELEQRLAKSCAECKEHLGNVLFTNSNGRICIIIPPEGGSYVHDKVQTSPFLVDIIKLFSNHHISIEDVCGIFKKYSADYVCEKQSTNEFDYLLYFNDKSIDKYYYCVKFEGEHAIYHRFARHDVQELLH